MKLPNRELAYVPISKLKDYLLSMTHAAGRTKAEFFRKFGFDETNLDLLREALIKIAHTQEVTEEVSSPYGKKYIINGTTRTSNDRIINLRTVWIIEKNQTKPRFVTTYPN